ncbi:MAG: FHA domain-containing protein [Deltaproteobacteria bacterium]|jgi:hypothetical protein|nr:FHA domain-containing protein [Deltaproteobacteria bacterium]
MRLVFGLRDLFGGRRRRVAKARRLELRGELAAAAELYAEAEFPGEAARVLLLLADAEPSPERRVVLCSQAARIGGQTEHGKKARRRKALLSFDLARSATGAALREEILAIAAELEVCGEWQKAAEAFGSVGDTANEVRVLEEAGAIEQLEGRLHQEAEQDRSERERRQLLTRMTDLDRVAERREALRIGDRWLANHDDEAVQLQAERIRARLLEGPSIQLEIDGQRLRCALGDEVTIGRSGATILVQSQSISRQHLRLFRRDGAPWVEDLDTRNGTLLGGARVDAPLPVGAGVSLKLAGQVDCRLAPADPSDPNGVVQADVAGTQISIPLGPLPVASWLVQELRDGPYRFVIVETPTGKEPPYLGTYRLVRQVELCVGDALLEVRDGPAVLRVPDQFQG